jgi:hypothetical protein
MVLYIGSDVQAAANKLPAITILLPIICIPTGACRTTIPDVDVPLPGAALHAARAPRGVLVFPSGLYKDTDPTAQPPVAVQAIGRLE